MVVSSLPKYPYNRILLFHRVKLLINRETGEAVAMKMVDLKKHPDAVLSIKKEVCIQKILQDPHILRYFGKRSQGDIEYLFLEYAAGGELFDRIGKLFFFSTSLKVQSVGRIFFCRPLNRDFNAEVFVLCFL